MEKEILEKFKKDFDLVVGVDEVGRGPIAGPVSVAAFAVTKKNYSEVKRRLDGVTDSKKLSEKKRDYFAHIIRELFSEGKVELSISSYSAEKIDALGIVPALKSCLDTSVDNVSRDYKKAYVFLDGSLYAKDSFSQETIIKGDSKNFLIACASVAAKVSRDLFMVLQSEKFPGYFFEKHKGYGTKLHYEKIGELGMSSLHRKTWIKK